MGVLVGAGGLPTIEGAKRAACRGLGRGSQMPIRFPGKESLRLDVPEVLSVALALLLSDLCRESLTPQGLHFLFCKIDKGPPAPAVVVR